MEVDGVATVVSDNKGAEAAGEGGEAIEGKDLENEREIREIGNRFRGGSRFEGRLRSRLRFKKCEEMER